MSRIGKKCIIIPPEVKVTLREQKISVVGPKGVLFRILPTVIYCRVNEEKKQICLEKVENTRLAQSLYGLSRTLVANMVIGVSNGFRKKLKIFGVGYRAQLNDKVLKLDMGYSHPIHLATPWGVSVVVETPTIIIVHGILKDAVGEFAAKIRSIRPPEPYKGKGIIYENEVIRRKAGKTGK